MNLKSLRWQLRGALLSTALLCNTAYAGFITFNEGLLDSIFSQSSFGATPVDVRLTNTFSLYNTDLLDIGSNAEFASLYSYSFTQNSRSLNLFYTDTISFCGGVTANIIGCGAVFGNVIALQSNYASGPRGSTLIAHEMGHNFGLSHQSSTLMNPSIGSNTSLTTSQVTSLLRSYYIQSDALGLYVNVNTIAIQHSSLAPITPVPEPSAWAMLFSGLFVIGAIAKRRKYP